MSVRAVVVGTGFGARVVAPALTAAGADVVDVISPRDAVAARIAAARPDLVSVHSPPFLHAEHVRAGLAVGAAVLCDKPCTPDAATTAALLAEIEAAGRLHLVNFEFRHDSARQELRRRVRAGVVGAVERIEWVHHSTGSTEPLRPYGWLFDRALGGGWIGAWASHAVDTVHWLLDDELEVEWSRPRTDVVERPDRDGVPRRCTAEDGLQARLRSRRDAVVVEIDSSFASSAPRTPTLTVRGALGSITSVGDGRLVTIDRDGRSDPAGEWRPPRGVGDPHLGPMRRWAEIVVASVAAGRAPDDAPTLRDGLAVDRVLDALRAG